MTANGVNPNYYNVTNEARLTICAMDCLQFSKDAQLHGACIDRAMNHHLMFLPIAVRQLVVSFCTFVSSHITPSYLAVQSEVKIPNTKQNYIFQDEYHGDAVVGSLFQGALAANNPVLAASAEATFVRALAAMPRDHWFYDGVRNNRYTFMVINVDNHFVALILHQSPRLSQGRTLTNIDHVIIADPGLSAAVKLMVWTRLR